MEYACFLGRSRSAQLFIAEQLKVIVAARRNTPTAGQRDLRASFRICRECWPDASRSPAPTRRVSVTTSAVSGDSRTAGRGGYGLLSTSVIRRIRSTLGQGFEFLVLAFRDIQ